MNDTLKKFPRTEREAFKRRHDSGVEGPFTEETTTDWQDKVVLVGCILSIAAVVLMSSLGWLI